MVVGGIGSLYILRNYKDSPFIQNNENKVAYILAAGCSTMWFVHFLWFNIPKSPLINNSKWSYSQPG